jgi:hypothetical protein
MKDKQSFGEGISWENCPLEEYEGVWRKILKYFYSFIVYVTTLPATQAYNVGW